MVKSRHCRHKEQDHKPIAPFADTINRSHTTSSDMAPTPDPPIHEGHTASSSTGTVLRLRRRRRPRISIAAIFLRFSRACGVPRRPARGHHSPGDSEPSVEDGNCEEKTAFVTNKKKRIPTFFAQILYMTNHIVPFGRRLADIYQHTQRL